MVVILPQCSVLYQSHQFDYWEPMTMLWQTKLQTVNMEFVPTLNWKLESPLDLRLKPSLIEVLLLLSLNKVLNTQYPLVQKLVQALGESENQIQGNQCDKK